VVEGSYLFKLNHTVMHPGIPDLFVRQEPDIGEEGVGRIPLKAPDWLRVYSKSIAPFQQSSISDPADNLLLMLDSHSKGKWPVAVRSPFECGIVVRHHASFFIGSLPMRLSSFSMKTYQAY